MNQIFKVVFNHVLGRHVVVSEVAGSIQRGTLKAVVAGMLAVAGLGMMPQAVAANGATGTVQGPDGGSYQGFYLNSAGAAYFDQEYFAKSIVVDGKNAFITLNPTWVEKIEEGAKTYELSAAAGQVQNKIALEFDDSKLKGYEITDFSLNGNTLSITQNNNSQSPLSVDNIATLDDIKTYSGEQKTDEGSDFGTDSTTGGSTHFTIYEKSSAPDTESGNLQEETVRSDEPAISLMAADDGADAEEESPGVLVGQMDIVAGNNVKITKTTVGENSEAALISAKNTVTVVENTDGTMEITPPDVKDADGEVTYTLGVKATEYAGDTGSNSKVKPGETLSITGGATEVTDEGNIGVVADGGKGLSVRLAKDIKGVNSLEATTINSTTVNSTTVNATTVKAGDTTINNEGVTINGGPTITKSNVDMGGQQIHNVAAGTEDTDAVNVSQLRDMSANYDQKINHLNSRIGEVAQDANAGIAMALAAASLPQAYLPGKSMMAIAGGTYRGQQGYAIGFSTISDNGKWVIKANATGNSQGHYGAAVGAGYMW